MMQILVEKIFAFVIAGIAGILLGALLLVDIYLL